MVITSRPVSHRWHCPDCGKDYPWREAEAVAQSDGDSHASECPGVEYWDVETFIYNWRGMESALRMLRNPIVQGAYAFNQGIPPPSYALGTINMYDVALCHAIEIALKSLIALGGKNVAEIKGYGHDIMRLFWDIDGETREYMQQFWEHIPPQVEINSQEISSAFSKVEGAFMKQRYGLWTGDQLILDLEPLWLFVITSQVVTQRYMLWQCRKYDWIRILGIGAASGDLEWEAGETGLLIEIDSPVGTAGPFWYDISLDESQHLRPYRTEVSGSVGQLAASDLAPLEISDTEQGKEQIVDLVAALNAHLVGEVWAHLDYIQQNLKGIGAGSDDQVKAFLQAAAPVLSRGIAALSAMFPITPGLRPNEHQLRQWDRHFRKGS